VAQRYGRVLEVTSREIGEALQGARAALKTGTSVATPRGSAPAPSSEAPAPAAPSAFARSIASRNTH
jgi:non-specific serine/threonine protein kinase